MKRTIVILSSIVVFAIVALASTSQAQQSPETMSKQQLNTLIATAKTPADQLRISRYYHFKALEYQAKAQAHEKMIADYKANPVLSTDKNLTATISHCEYLVATFNKLAETSQQLAAAHQWMAEEIPANLRVAGN